MHSPDAEKDMPERLKTSASNETGNDVSTPTSMVSLPQNKTAADAENIAAAIENGQQQLTLEPPIAQGEAALDIVPKRQLFPVVTPWPHEVQLSDVLDEIRTIVGRHVVVSKEELDIVALWVAFSYCLDNFRHSPRLLVTSPDMQCGKTTMMEVIGALANRAFHASNMSPAVIYRVMEKYRPTLLADEADTYIYDDEQMRNILNQGHTKAGAWVARCAPKTLEPEIFYAYSAMVIGQIGWPPATVADRSIPIRMRRKKPSEAVVPFLPDNPTVAAMCAKIRAKLLRWAQDNAGTLAVLEPALPPILQNRNADKWRPLFTIASLAGNHWPSRAELASQHIMRHSDADDSGLPTQLLADMRIIVRESGEAEMKSYEVLEKLNSLEDRPWSTINGGRKLDGNKLGNMLRPFGIRSSVIRWPDGQRQRGYYFGQFADAFARYLPPDPIPSTP